MTGEEKVPLYFCPLFFLLQNHVSREHAPKYYVSLLLLGPEAVSNKKGDFFEGGNKETQAMAEVGN